MELNKIEKINHKYSKFIQENGHKPLYARCKLEWNDEINKPFHAIIKLSGEVDNLTDEKIFFYCNDMDDFIMLTVWEQEDFLLMGVDEFFDEL